MWSGPSLFSALALTALPWALLLDRWPPREAPSATRCECACVAPAAAGATPEPAGPAFPPAPGLAPEREAERARQRDSLRLPALELPAWCTLLAFAGGVAAREAVRACCAPARGPDGGSQ